MQVVWKTIVYACTAYFILCFFVFLFQRKLLYYPDQSQLSVEGADRLNLYHWPSYQNFRGFISANKFDNTKGTVIIFHGNAGTAFHRYFYAEALSKQNMRVILAEYPGYGGRKGQPSEQSFTDDAHKTIKMVHQEFDGPLFLWGESLGCGVVANAVKEAGISIKGIALLLPWDRLVNLAQGHYWYLPVQLLLKDKYDSIANLKGFNGRVAVLIAENDEIIPVSHSKALYQTISAEKRIWIFKNATHNNFPITPEKSWWKEVVNFLNHQP